SACADSGEDEQAAEGANEAACRDNDGGERTNVARALRQGEGHVQLGQGFGTGAAVLHSCRCSKPHLGATTRAEAGLSTACRMKPRCYGRNESFVHGAKCSCDCDGSDFVVFQRSDGEVQRLVLQGEGWMLSCFEQFD